MFTVIFKSKFTINKKYPGQETDLYPRKTRLTKFELSRRNVSNSINIAKTLRDIATKIYYVLFTYLLLYVLCKALLWSFRAVACSSFVTVHCYIRNTVVFGGGLHN